jgi:hypothetical protein
MKGLSMEAETGEKLTAEVNFFDCFVSWKHFINFLPNIVIIIVYSFVQM